MYQKAYPLDLQSLNKEGENGIFKEYCESTSLHGYSYLYIAKSKLAKSIWVICILIMSFIAVYFFVTNTAEYWNSRLVTTIESSTAPLVVCFWDPLGPSRTL